MSKTDARMITSSWQAMDADSFNSLVSRWAVEIPEKLDDEYRVLRNEIITGYRQAVDEVALDESLKTKAGYMTDLKFGLRLHEILKGHEFSLRMASNDQVWIYLCVEVVPDIVQSRYPGSKVDGEPRNVNEDRFWKTRRRIYLKTIWWYIFLSLQKDEYGRDDLHATYEILKNNSTDEIVQLVERSGKAGYRVDVYRELMRFYAENRQRYEQNRFRKVMVMNTARTQIVEPALMEGGVREYVKELFDYFDE